MRTKTLLAAAILAAGIATSMAQSNVYSQNVVGYVSKAYSTGWHILANPLQATNNAIGNIIPNPPFFSVVYKFTGGTYSAANTFAGAWTDTSMQLAPGEGAFLYIPAGPYTNTYVGEVLQGNLTNTLIAGFNLVGTKVPQAGGVQTVHQVVPSFFDVSYQWDDPNQTYFGANTWAGGWNPAEPNIAVAEGFWYYNNSGANNNWVRNFSVPTP
jgi:hypothetical protein